MENYEVLDLIGKGNFGSISKILRKSDDKILVWKELDYGRMSEKEKQNIVSEVNILRELHHPNIVRYYDRIIDKKNTKIYIIMEYCEGGDIGLLIKRLKKTKEYIPEEIIWKIFTQLILALLECHNHKEGKILHRDIKPSNVFLDGDNNIKLGDFGLSRMLSNESVFAYSHVGTPYYMSPEQIEEMKYNEKSDIWSLGCFLYEVATFTPPFEATNQLSLALKIKAGKIEPIPNRYSSDLSKVIMWMLNVNQEKRPNVDELVNYPPVLMRIKERKLKEHYIKIKKAEETLLEKENEIKERENTIKIKEEEVMNKEKEVNKLKEELDVRKKELDKREEDIQIKEMELMKKMEELQLKEEKMKNVNKINIDNYNDNNINVNDNNNVIHNVISNKGDIDNNDIKNIINKRNNLNINHSIPNNNNNDIESYLTNNGPMNHIEKILTHPTSSKKPEIYASQLTNPNNNIEQNTIHTNNTNTIKQNILNTNTNQLNTNPSSNYTNLFDTEQNTFQKNYHTERHFQHFPQEYQAFPHKNEDINNYQTQSKQFIHNSISKTLYDTQPLQNQHNNYQMKNPLSYNQQQTKSKIVMPVNTYYPINNNQNDINYYLHGNEFGGIQKQSSTTITSKKNQSTNNITSVNSQINNLNNYLINLNNNNNNVGNSQQMFNVDNKVNHVNSYIPSSNNNVKNIIEKSVTIKKAPKKNKSKP